MTLTLHALITDHFGLHYNGVHSYIFLTSLCNLVLHNIFFSTIRAEFCWLNTGWFTQELVVVILHLSYGKVEKKINKGLS